MAVTLSNFVTSLTKNTFLPIIAENFYTGNALYMRLRDKKKSWSNSARLVIPTEIAGRTQLGSYSGADTFGVAQEDTRAQFAIDVAQYYASITFSGIQIAANKGKEAIVDLMTAEFASVSRALKDKMGSDLYLDGTGNSNKDVTGLVVHVDDGKLKPAVNKSVQMLETLARLFVLSPYYTYSGVKIG